MKTDHANHPIILHRVLHDPRGRELVLSYDAQMAVFAARAFARGGGFARHRVKP